MEQRHRLKQIRNMLGLSQTQFASRINYPASSIAAIEAGNQKLPAILAYRLQDMIVVDENQNARIITPEFPKKSSEYYMRAEWLFRGMGEPFETMQQPFGNGILNLNLFQGNGKISLPVNDEFVFFQMQDNYMADVLHKSDIVAIDTGEKEIVSGQIYLINLFNEYVVRRIINANLKTIIILAENIDIIPKITVEKCDVDIIGKLKYVIKIL